MEDIMTGFARYFQHEPCPQCNNTMKGYVSFNGMSYDAVLFRCDECDYSKMFDILSPED